MKNCIICSNPFTPSYPSRKTCSKECSHLALSASATKRVVIDESYVQRVHQMIGNGLNNQEIARGLGISLAGLNKLKKKHGIKHTPEQIQAIRDRASAKRRMFDEHGKTCASCKEKKPLDAFNKAAGKPSGVTDYCKECSKKSYAENPESIKQRVREWTASNKEKKKQMDREYYLNNAEKIIAKNKKRRQEQSSIIDIGACHQYKRRQGTEKEDCYKGMLFNLKVSDFTLQYEKFTKEHADFIKKYEWMGKIGTQPKWTFTARYNNFLAGVVMIGEPDAFTNDFSTALQAQIKRGACASWAPKNLNSKLVMFAIRETVKRSEKRAFYAYSDHEAGEIGTIYQACNFIYLGSSYGSDKKFVMKNGKKVSSRYFTRTSTVKRYMKELGIAIDKNWFCEKGFIKTEKMPKEVVEEIDKHRKKETSSCDKIKSALKGKYLYVLGVNKRETKELIKQMNKKITKQPYPKRGSV